MNSLTKAGVALSAVLVIAGCEPVDGTSTSVPLTMIPESVREAAAPYQDVSTARVNPVDGCYEYRHVGPVETTMLPLRTVNGNPICTRPEN